jgi:hypothetical protein
MDSHENADRVPSDAEVHAALARLGDDKLTASYMEVERLVAERDAAVLAAIERADKWVARWWKFKTAVLIGMVGIGGIITTAALVALLGWPGLFVIPAFVLYANYVEPHRTRITAIRIGKGIPTPIMVVLVIAGWIAVLYGALMRYG